MKVQLTPRALRRARIITDWWRTNRLAGPELFAQEFEHAMNRLTAMSAQGPIGTTHGQLRGKTIWRVLLPKTLQHVYYTVDEVNETVVIRTIWGAQRGQRPKL